MLISFLNAVDIELVLEFKKKSSKFFLGHHVFIYLSIYLSFYIAGVWRGTEERTEESKQTNNQINSTFSQIPYSIQSTKILLLPSK